MKLDCDPICLYSSSPPSGIRTVGQPVWVPHGDGIEHWEFLVTKAVYDTLDEEDKKTFTKVKDDKDLKKWLKNEEIPRHVFGPGGGYRDPDYEYPDFGELAP